MDKFEEHEMKKIRPIIRKWFDRLIKQSVIENKPKLITDKPKIMRDKLKDKIIRDILRLFRTERKGEQKEKERKELEKKKHNEKKKIKII